LLLQQRQSTRTKRLFCTSNSFGNSQWKHRVEEGTKATQREIEMAARSKEILPKLRDLMKHQYGLDAYIIYSEDAHQSEYTPECDKRRAFVSGFTGSAGIAVVTLNEAALWTDGRYFLQADKQLSPRESWQLMKMLLPETPSIQDWLIRVLPKGAKVGLDPKLVSNGTARTLRQAFELGGLEFHPVFDNLVDKVWTDKPNIPTTPVFVHRMEFAGRSHLEKIKYVAQKLQDEKADALVVSALDEIAWLFNLRGSDVTYNPVFISYALVTKDALAKLFILPSKVNDSQEVVKHLAEAQVEVLPYDKIFEEIQELGRQRKKVWLDPVKGSLALFSLIAEINPALILEKFSPITYAKSIKNEAELEGLRRCHLRDARALITFLCWIEERIQGGDTSLNEWVVAQKLDSLRGEQDLFVSLSFPTISSSGANAAVIHYSPEAENAAPIRKDWIYLVDSGGQYRDGTTDVTRTVHFGTPTHLEKRNFTLVLQGHINLATAVFPEGTIGNQLDLLARTPLWKHGLDYRHGTGHGVGAFLNVHEGPQSVSFRESAYKQPMEAGMTITDEPGYYEDGQYGIRIESVLVVRNANTENHFGGKKYFEMENITFVPIHSKLIDTSILSPAEIEWVNNYHKLCLEKVGPLLSGKELEWLKNQTQPLKL